MRAPCAGEQLPPGEVPLGLDCCRGDADLYVELRVLGDTIQHCVSLVSHGVEESPGVGVAVPARFKDAGMLFRSGAFGFIPGDEGPVTIRRIEVIPLSPERPSDPHNPSLRYYQKDFACPGS